MNIRTNQVTQGAMYCALYGILLFVNQQFGLIIETSLPSIFSLPILVCAAKSEKNISWIVGLTMIIMTFLFGSFTTWFYSWSSILIGLLYGTGVRKKWSMMTNFMWTTLLSIVVNFFTVFVWAKLFGMELTEDYMMFQAYIPNVSLATFMACFVLLLSVLEGLSIHFIAILILRRLRVPMAEMKNIFQIQSPFYVGVLSISLWVLYYLCTNVIECSHEVVGFFQVVLLMDYFILDFFGAIVMLSLCVLYQKRKIAFLATLGAMIPVVQWIWIFVGLMDCFFQIRKKMMNKRTVL
ncbi:MAG: DUF2232 domain-containing protein [Firmicutes bacterium]|nr:DUF2232 domain-containing protein [Bacillota bacterium]